MAPTVLDPATLDLRPFLEPNDLIVVAHFGVILTQVQRALQMDADQAFGHKIDNLSVTEITRDATGWSVTRINHIP